ncbi:alpha-L-fucosidase [Olivibacter ginsenosidimutans]|uniref:alpha-L-fucosidase n=1 Tax=Olivibacter ginsenosidimutans TaxID=1176537 RepID=A0ABP9BYJ9_9SPHI
MKHFLTLLCLLFARFYANAQNTDVLPSPAHVAWADAEVGAIFHLDLVNFEPDYDWRNWGTHPSAKIFNPSKLNTDQWVQAAKSAGATYAVLVAKHCSGFSLWPTAAHDYSVKSSPWKNGKGDIVRDFIASCKKYGLKPGIYASASANGYLYVDNPGKVQKGSPVTQQQYNAIVKQQLTELWSNYGNLFEIWFDGGVLPVEAGGPDLAPLLKKLQPNAVIFQGPSDAKNLIRWVGNEEGKAPYPNWSRSDFTTSATGTIKIDSINGNPEGKIWCPGEADFPLRTGWQGGWFWKADGQKMLSTDALLQAYYTSVGRNSNMLLGIVIDTSGLVPQEDYTRLSAFGSILKGIKRTNIGGLSNKNGKSFELDLGQSHEINQVEIMEDIRFGERIRRYEVQAWIDHAWKTVAEGTSVGHKRLQVFETVKTPKVRLMIHTAQGEPRIKQFTVSKLATPVLQPLLTISTSR